MASWQQGHHAMNGAHNYFWGAHKHNPETRTLADDFWRYHGSPEPVQAEHAIELNKAMIQHGLGEHAFLIHKDVPYAHQSSQIERLTAPFATRLPTVHPMELKIPPELKPHSLEDLEVIGSFMSQLHYDPREIMDRLEVERQKMAQGFFEEVGGVRF